MWMTMQYNFLGGVEKLRHKSIHLIDIKQQPPIGDRK